MDTNTEIVSRVIYFLFPYNVKCYESEQWITGHDPSDKDWDYGHPDGHEITGHGYIPDWMKTTGNPVQVVKENVETTTTSSIFKRNAEEVEEATMNVFGTVVFFYSILLICSLIMNAVLAAIIKGIKWGLKHALIFHLCFTGILLAVSTTIHFVASTHHLVFATITAKRSLVLQLFAIVAWIDHAVEFSLLFFIFYLSIFCFFFYWKNRERSQEWGRSRVVLCVLTCWALSFAASSILSIFECDAHFSPLDYCISIFCAAGNVFSMFFTQALLHLKIVIPTLTVIALAFSIRVGSANVAKRTLVRVEGADNKTDRHLMLSCTLIFVIYELATLTSHFLHGFCFQPILAVFIHHFMILVTTLAAPIGIFAVDNKIRQKLLGFLKRKKTAPIGSFAFTSNKYKDTERRDSIDSVHESNRRSSIAVVPVPSRLPSGPPSYEAVFLGSRRDSCTTNPPSYTAGHKTFEFKKRPLPSQVLF